MQLRHGKSHFQIQKAEIDTVVLNNVLPEKKKPYQTYLNIGSAELYYQVQYEIV